MWDADRSIRQRPAFYQIEQTGAQLKKPLVASLDRETGFTTKFEGQINAQMSVRLSRSAPRARSGLMYTFHGRQPFEARPHRGSTPIDSGSEVEHRSDVFEPSIVPQRVQFD